MDINSFSNAVTITPPVQINNLMWNENNTSLVIATEGHQFQTSYTLFIDASVTDVNGRELDGDANGVEGDPFVLNYQTNEADILGPQIIYNYPSNNDLSIDIGSIVTIVFDEEIDAQTLSAADMVLINDSSPVNFSFQHTNAEDGRSIVCIQPQTLFDREANYILTFSGNVADTLGNINGTPSEINFTTSGLAYSE